MSENGPGNIPSPVVRRLVQNGFRALHAGDRHAAADFCRRALEEMPDMPRAHYLAALIALEGGNHPIAIKALQKTVELRDDHSAAWAQLAQVYLLTGEFVKAEGCLENAVNTEQGKAAVSDLIGTAFRLAGNLEASKHWHERAVDKEPGHVPFLINLANVHLYFGEQQAAEDQLDRCLELQPSNPQVHWLLSRTSKVENVWHIEAMQDLLAEERDSRGIAYLNYAIGKEAEDIEDWQLAFAAFSQGAEARRETVAFDERNEIDVFDTVTGLFTKAWLEHQEPGPNVAAPIFIVGEPRSGTTLLDRMIAAHSAVNSAGELRHLGFALRQVSGLQEPRQFSPQLVRAAATADMSAIGVAYLRSTESLLGNAAHLIDKLPGNYLYLPLILAALPNAKILHLTRDPMDACFAMYKQLFADAYLYSYDQQELARHYVRYARLMETWRERFPGRFLDVSYEDLVTDSEETLRTVFEHVGLSWQRQCLDFHKDQSAVTTASAAQVREKPHQRSIGRWKRYEQQLQPMRDVLAESGLSLLC
jgi:tetratricopeptide (TPR) repeat protein